jgi:hypothetical protein
MGKKVGSKNASERAMSSKADDAITEDKLLGYFTVAYVLDAAGMLDSRKKSKLDSLVVEGCPSWDKSVEERYGLSRTLVRNIYAVCSEVKTPAEVIGFILRGLECPDYRKRLQEVTGA